MSKNGHQMAYPVYLWEDSDKDITFYVDIPDFNISTQGMNLFDAIQMARDAIGLIGIDMMDDEDDLPVPGSTSPKNTTGILTYIDIDFDKYRAEVINE